MYTHMCLQILRRAFWTVTNGFLGRGMGIQRNEIQGLPHFNPFNSVFSDKKNMRLLSGFVFTFLKDHFGL